MKFYKRGDAANEVYLVLTLIGVCVLTLRVLITFGEFQSALLYLAWPFGLSLALYYFTPHTDGSNWLRRFWNNLRLTMIVILATSLMLMEGYVCVVMALPIFGVGVVIAFIAAFLYNKFGKNSAGAYVVPALFLLISLEGVVDATTFERYNEVVHSQVVQVSAQTIRARLANPPPPSGARHWLLKIFPMPKTIGSVKIEQGAVRTYEFVYHRWFATNTHYGQLKVNFDEVSADKIKTTITDTSYIASYMKLHGTELTLEPMGKNETRVSLKVRFDRMIDPVWYFEPLERFAVKKASQYFVEALLARAELAPVEVAPVEVSK